MEGWVNTELDKLVNHMQSGGTPKSDNSEFYSGNIPFVTIDDMTNSDKYLFDTKKKISKAGLQSSSAWLIPENTLMYSIYATLGLPLISKIEAATNQAILNIIVDKNKIDNEFLYYHLLHKRQFILKFSAHTTQSNLNATIVKHFNIHYPKSLPEQKKIAQILSTIDQAIEQTQKLIAKYQSIKTGLMQDLLTKGIDKNGNIRSEKTHKFKDSPLGRIPEEWEKLKFKNICTVRQGLQIAIDKRHKISSKNRYIYITVQYLNNPKRYLEYIENPDTNVICYKSDILFTRTGNTGQIITGISGVYHNNFFKIQFDKNVLDKDYLVYFLNWKPIQNLIKDLAGTTTIPDLNHSDFYSLPIIYPNNISEQKNITTILKKHDKIIQTEQNYLHKLQQQKTGLMQDLLSGKVRVNELLKEKNN